ncbi:MFS transporter [Streptomyces sp. MUM 203J]|uniref:MFS transporter n=1 Tax=Streptomyces sp. MUM 203J TaxID=2791990 RepID=UPI001F0430DE|nr:MFS transporter [Streptomyces sp. MUM 203J]MCH0540511.1 MFS transporter [Streptomyces sp. MUM 203J]
MTGRDRRPLAAVLAANTVSITGNSLTLIGVPWFVLETTGSAGRAGLVALCTTAPVVVSALAGGPVIDRVGRRRISVLSDLVCALAVAAIPLLHQAGRLPFWALCALMAVTGLFHAPGETARGVLVPHLAERAGTRLERATGLYESVARGARMAGAALAGLLIALVGAETVLLLDAATFAVSAALVAGGLRGLPAAEPLRDGPPVSAARYRAELREGYGFVARDRLLLAIVLMVMFTNGLNVAWSSVMLPVHAREHLDGAAAVGLVMSVFGGCALLGALGYGAVGHRFRRRPVYTWSFLLAGAPLYLVPAATESVWPLLVTVAVGGFCSGTLNPILTTVFFERVPDRLRSRVSGVTTAGVLLTAPLGGVTAGFLTEHLGLVPTLLATGALYFLATLSPLFPTWRGLDEPAGHRRPVRRSRTRCPQPFGPRPLRGREHGGPGTESPHAAQPQTGDSRERAG